ncbi:hypothetical protein EIP86_005739 [Pleurotus ostreatoroseus]|nr:hypothetical protein EIP86_005739 [Pleurotus ostreatoroseus]
MYALMRCTICMPKVLLSRFIINLRQFDIRISNSTVTQQRSRFSTITFRVPTKDEVIGNLGEPLDFGAYQVDDGEHIEHVDLEAQQETTGDARRSSVAEIEAGPSFTRGDGA